MDLLIKIVWKTALLLGGLITCFCLVVIGCAVIVDIWEELRESKE